MENIKSACELSIQNWIGEFPTEFPETVYSKKHTKRMNVLINKMRNDTYHHLTTRAVKVLFIAAVLLSFLLVAFTIPSTRDFIIDRYERYSTYVVAQTRSNSIDDGITLGYVPNGFELTEKNTGTSLSTEVYYCGEKYFVAEKYVSKAKVLFDTEKDECKTVVFDDISYTVFKNSSNGYGIIWNENDSVYIVNGNISEDELFEIAKQIK